MSWLTSTKKEQYVYIVVVESRGPAGDAYPLRTIHSVRSSETAAESDVQKIQYIEGRFGGRVWWEKYKVE